MRQFYLLFRHFILLCLPLIIFSCNESTVDPELFGSISGTVKTSEEAGSLPMEGVTITTNPGTTSVTTNSDGSFSLSEVNVGDVTVNAKKEGYTAVSTPVKVQEGKELVMQVVMGIAPLDSTIPDDITYVSPLDIQKDATRLPNKVNLVWRNGETEKGDTLRFDVIIFEGASDENGTKVASNILDTTFTVQNLKFEQTYEWQIVARNKQLDEVEGKKWRFTTENFPKNGYLFVKDTLGSRDIYSWDLAENHLVRLTKDGGSEVSPRISPNEELIAYASNKSGEYHIYTMDTKGENVVKVTNDKSLVSYNNSGSGFVWSPEGDQILYGHYGDLYTINYNGTGETKIANAPVNRHFKSCDWSAHFNNVSQEKIAVLTQGEKPYDNEIYLMDPDGSNLFLLLGNLEGTISSPHFSPDGTKVIFSLDSLFQDDNGRQLNAKIYSVNIDGTNWTDLSGDDKPAGTNDLQARYTETGGKIIFMNVANDNEGKKNIWIMDTDGSNREKIISNGEMPDLYNP
ncbi:carboxypeptidase regulatory-like domain-containing protein [Labilibaculum manganireducens]|uniref:carboxypeptidase regulatory-like domain-containing protein n=1 Tax=Labilibaculum manganireducens TaxID=1940525 RepID=UPI0029F552B7|nr:carboxypeptidase regulatory-like domain-containing protein [Labilibaculum manganireducens]